MRTGLCVARHGIQQRVVGRGDKLRRIQRAELIGIIGLVIVGELAILAQGGREDTQQQPAVAGGGVIKAQDVEQPLTDGVGILLCGFTQDRRRQPRQQILHRSREPGFSRRRLVLNGNSRRRRQ